MDVQKRDGKPERRILIAMIVNEFVLARIAQVWDKRGCFRSKWCNIVGKWCVDYHNRYGKAPGKAIEGLFESWSEEANDPEAVGLVEKFLATISGEYAALRKDINADYIIDLASEHFNRTRLTRLAEVLMGDMDAEGVEKALQTVGKFGRVELGTGTGVDVLNDQTAIAEAFEDKKEPLITYKGDLGRFFRDALERDAFIAFMGPEKRGKTWWLLDLAWNAMLQRKRVAFFEVGDMSRNQILRRFMIRASKRPLRATESGKPVKYPTAIDRDLDAGTTNVTHDERTFDKPLTFQKAWAACQEVLKTKIKTSDSMLKLDCYPNSTLSVSGISTTLRNWEKASGWTPDVIVIDYADVLLPASGSADTRDQINATWKALRALSQEFHCLVVTATQADAASYKSETLDRTNFSEDKRKLAHVTGMVGINQTPEEKDNGVMRLNWIVLRESEFSEGKCVHVAGCLAVGNPAIRSTF